MAHARHTADRLTVKHGVESLCLTGEVSQQERHTAIERLQDANDPLTVICTVELFNEGIDIPELSHLLFLRPTQSFTVFLQQLGRGLRKTPGKEYLVVIDLVGNYRKAHVAPLALMGYTSIEECVEDRKSRQTKKAFVPEPPAGCFISADYEVRRIWDKEFREALKTGSRADRLKDLYQEIRDDLQCASPSLMDFIASPYDVDPYIFIKQFGNWLRTKRTCEDKLPPDEKHLLDTPAERFLEHLEKELSPVKSYKMVVLKTLLVLPGHSWQVSDIASGFLAYYLEHRDHMHDYDDLARASAPEHFPIRQVEEHIRKNPLHFLSNKGSDWFILDQRTFSLKEEIVPFWTDQTFRSLVTDRVEFVLHRYFYLRSRQAMLHLSPDIPQEGVPLDKNVVMSAFSSEPLRPGKDKDVTVILEGQKYEKNRVIRSGDGKDYRLKLSRELQGKLKEIIAEPGVSIKIAVSGKNALALKVVEIHNR